VQASLLTGVLGVTAQPALIEILGFVLYAVPMLAVVLWPPKRQLSRGATGRLLTGVGIVAAVVAVVFAVTAPAVPTGGQVTVPVTIAIADTFGPDGAVVPAHTVDGTATVSVSDDSRLRIEVTAGDLTLTGTAAATQVGSEYVDGTRAVQYRSAPLTSTPRGVPATLTGDQIAALAGRLPIGLRAADAADAMPAVFTDSARATVSVTPDGQQIVEVTVKVTRSVGVTTPSGLPITLGSADGMQVTTTPAGRVELARAAADRAATVTAAEVRGEVVPLMLGGFAIIMLAFGLPKLFRRPAGIAPTSSAANPPGGGRTDPIDSDPIDPDPIARDPITRDPVAPDPLAAAGAWARTDAG
jgi:high-affinity iron transporter